MKEKIFFWKKVIFWDFSRFSDFLVIFDHFLIFFFLWIFWFFLNNFFWLFDFFLDFLLFIFIFEFFKFFWNIWISFGFFWFFGIPFKVTKVATKSYQGYYWTPTITKNGPKQYYKLYFWTKGIKSLGRRPKPFAGARVGPCSGPYLLVVYNFWLQSVCLIFVYFYWSNKISGEFTERALAYYSNIHKIKYNALTILFKKKQKTINTKNIHMWCMIFNWDIGLL